MPRPPPYAPLRRRWRRWRRSSAPSRAVQPAPRSASSARPPCSPSPARSPKPSAGPASSRRRSSSPPAPAVASSSSAAASVSAFPDLTNASRHIEVGAETLLRRERRDRHQRARGRLRRHRLRRSNGRQPTRLTRQANLQGARQAGRRQRSDRSNPYEKWSDIDPSLPAKRSRCSARRPTSGTRDAFVELVMDVGCAQFPDSEGPAGRAGQGGLQPDPRGRRVMSKPARTTT